VVDFPPTTYPWGFDDWINLVEIGFDVSRPGGWLERKPLCVGNGITSFLSSASGALAAPASSLLLWDKRPRGREDRAAWREAAQHHFRILLSDYDPHWC
jgi:hypothetical protein